MAIILPEKYRFDKKLIHFDAKEYFSKPHQPNLDFAKGNAYNREIMQHYNIVIIGGGILGSNLARWIGQLYTGKILLLEKDADVACHTSGRNTGVIHRPFYLDPQKRRFFALAAQTSYPMWKNYAAEKKLPWSSIGTIEVAKTPEDVAVIEKYAGWAIQNGMGEEEVDLLSAEQVRRQEPRVECCGALFAKTDTCVDFGLLTRAVKTDAQALGVEFRFNSSALQLIERPDGILIYTENKSDPILADTVVNVAGGESIDLAHSMGLGSEYTDLHFRGDYWQVDPSQAQTIRSNIYSVPTHKDLPFLDPHWIVRSDGRIEIGPNAVLVASPYTYDGLFNSWEECLEKIIERPWLNKLSLFVNPRFLQLAKEEWRSSFYKTAMLRRIQEFIPSLRECDLTQRGTGGVRSSVIDAKGNFIKEAIELTSPRSLHILNYNSPGATGAPAYSAWLLQQLKLRGQLQTLHPRATTLQSLWNWQKTIEQFQ